jgi:hypothetical protein
MARAGAFSAAFNPDTLDRFRSLCRQNNEQYSKVLERLAEMYLETEGGILAGVSVPSSSRDSKQSNAGAHTSDLEPDLRKRLERLEENDEYNEETFSTVFKRLEEVEKKLSLGKYQK